jgi:hypothetical protein
VSAAWASHRLRQQRGAAAAAAALVTAACCSAAPVAVRNYVGGGLYLTTSQLA